MHRAAPACTHYIPLLLPRMQASPKYCVACRGEHVPGRACDPAWQPYTPRQRLANLHLLTSRFQVHIRLERCWAGGSPSASPKQRQRA